MKVLFYYPIHFCRNGNSLPEFIIPMVDSLLKFEVDFMCIEESINLRDFRFKSSKNIYSFLFCHYCILFFRKVVPLSFFSSFELREQFIGRILKIVTLNFFKADTIITLSNSMGGFWRGYNKNATIIDYQHGLVDSTQPGYFRNSSQPTDCVKINNKFIAVWGDKFNQIFYNNSEYYKDKVFTIGYFNKTHSNIIVKDLVINRIKILFSLQFTPSMSSVRNKTMLEVICSNLSELSKLPTTPMVYLRPHPRHDSIIQYEYLASKYKFVFIDLGLLNPSKYDFHFTFHSTVAIDMAIAGVPTYFYKSDLFPEAQQIFFEEYDYPVFNKETLCEELIYYSNNPKEYKSNSRKLSVWGNTFYQEFNQQEFLRMIKQ